MASVLGPMTAVPPHPRALRQVWHPFGDFVLQPQAGVTKRRRVSGRGEEQVVFAHHLTGIDRNPLHHTRGSLMAGTG